MTTKRDGSRVSWRAMMTIALGIAGVAAAFPAAAQEADEIIVTATRRDTALQDVPIAVTPVTAEMIENSGIRDVQDLTSVAPSLQFNVSESEASSTARLRGVGTQGSNPGLESAVGIFIDGVYRARNGVALSDLGEVNQIEVLRGPQGTLFGRNTSAGLITINSRAPDLNDFEAHGEVTYGDFNETRVAAGVNFPLVEDRLGLRLFAAVADRDGFMDMNSDGANPLLTDDNRGEYDSNTRGMYTVRGQLLWDNGSDASFRFIMDYSERDEDCCAAQIYDPERLNGNPVTILTAAGVEGTPIPFGFGRQQWIANLGGYGPNVSVANPLGGVGNGDLDNREGFSNRGYDQNVEDYGLSGELNWETDIGDFTSITAYRNWTTGGGSDSDYSQADLLYVPEGPDNSTEFQVFTQELRLSGELGALSWLVGAYYSNEQINRRFSFLTGSQYAEFFAGLDNILVGGTMTPGLGNAPSAGVSAVVNNLYDELADPVIGIPAGAGTAGYNDIYHQDGTSIAVFTHNIWALSPSTDLTFGIRFTHERKELRASFNTLFDGEAVLDAAISDAEADAGVPAGTFAAFSNCDTAGAPSTNSVIVVARSGYCVPWLRDDLDAIGYDQERSEDEWSGVVSLRHEFTDNVSAYASFSRGYKGGGFNLDRDFSTVFVGTPPDTSFEAEFVDAYEIGFKTDWFSNDLILNLAIYHNEYENFQLNTFNGIQFVVTTVPEVTVDGAELDLIWRTPIDGLSIQGGIAYNDAAYGEDCTPLATCGGWVQNNRNPITGELTLARLPGSNLTNSPEYTATTSFTYERPLFNSGLMGLLYLDARYVDDQNTGSDLRPSKDQPSYTLLNARVGLSDPDDRWTVELWARNLTDEAYGQIMFDVPLQLGTNGPTQGAFMGDPRTFGVTLRARY